MPLAGVRTLGAGEASLLTPSSVDVGWPCTFSYLAMMRSSVWTLASSPTPSSVSPRGSRALPASAIAASRPTPPIMVVERSISPSLEGSGAGAVARGCAGCWALTPGRLSWGSVMGLRCRGAYPKLPLESQPDRTCTAESSWPTVSSVSPRYSGPLPRFQLGSSKAPPGRDRGSLAPAPGRAMSKVCQA